MAAANYNYVLLYDVLRDRPPTKDALYFRKIRPELDTWNATNSIPMWEWLTVVASDPILATLRSLEPLESVTWEKTYQFRTSSNLDLWAHSLNPANSRMTRDWLENKANRREAALSHLEPSFSPTANKFEDKIAEAFLDHDVVVAVIPPGFGKSTLGALSIHKLRVLESRLPNSRALRPGDIGWRIDELTKILQVAPTPSNAVSVARYLNYQTDDPSIRGYVNPLLSDSGETDPDIDGVNDVIVPLTVAHRMLSYGRFKALIIDEAHMDDFLMECVMMKGLDAMKGVPETGAHSIDEERKRLDKMLILVGIESQDLQHKIVRAVEGEELTAKVLRLPTTPAEWNRRRHEVYDMNLSTRPLPPAHPLHDLSTDIATRLRMENVASSDDKLELHELPYYSDNGWSWLTDKIVPRLAIATKAMMRHLLKPIKEVALERRGKNQLEKETHGVALSEFTPQVVPNIIVFVPSTGAGKQLYTALTGGNDDNVMLPDDRGNLSDYVQPYSIHMCSRDSDEEELLTRTYIEEALFRNDGPGGKEEEEIKPSRAFETSKAIRKGRVLIVRNGAELGLTINNVGGIVESCMEEMDCYKMRCGLSCCVFKFSDIELVTQRAGRGGRTRDTTIIRCLSERGVDEVVRRGDRIALEKVERCINARDRCLMMWHPRTPIFIHTIHENDIWNELEAEVHVNGSIEFPPNLGLPNPKPMLRDDAFYNQEAFPYMSPATAQLLRAFIGSHMTLHGLVLAAILETGVTALQKPSSSNLVSHFGPSPQLNSLDIFRAIMLDIEHPVDAFFVEWVEIDQQGVRHEHKKEMRYLRPWDGDLIPLVEFHVQHIIASEWDGESRVPTRDEVDTRPTPHDASFFSHSWEKNSTEANGAYLRMNSVRAGEPGGFRFVNRRLIMDEERKTLWSWIRLTGVHLKLAGLIKNISDIFEPEHNRLVRNLDSAPLLTQTGRALFSALKAMFSTRFARIVEKGGERKKTKGQCKEYLKVVNEQNAVHYSQLTRKIRAESAYDAHPHHTWMAFEPSKTVVGGDKKIDRSNYFKKEREKAEMKKKEAVMKRKQAEEALTLWTSQIPAAPSSSASSVSAATVAASSPSTVPKEPSFIVVSHPFTNEQIAIFANVAGRWRMKKPEVITGGTDELLLRDMWILEIETNACTSLKGFMIKGHYKIMERVQKIREWLRTHIPLTTIREDPDKGYEDALYFIAKLWIAVGPPPPPSKPYGGQTRYSGDKAYFEDDE